MAFAIVSKPTVALQQRLTGPVRRRASVLCRAAAQPINPDIKKEEAKVVDMVSSADITGKVCPAGREHSHFIHTDCLSCRSPASGKRVPTPPLGGRMVLGERRKLFTRAHSFRVNVVYLIATSTAVIVMCPCL